MEQFPIQPTTQTLEQARNQVKEKIAEATAHALDIDQEGAFIDEYEKLLHQYFDTEIKDPQLEISSARIEAATVFAQTIPELRIVLEELGIPPEHSLDIVEHENAHANVIDQEFKYQKNKGYGMVLMKKDGVLVTAQPFVGGEKKDEISMLDYLKSAIRSTGAPEVYGHQLSEGDQKDIATYKTLIEKKEELDALYAKDPDAHWTNNL